MLFRDAGIVPCLLFAPVMGRPLPAGHSLPSVRFVIEGQALTSGIWINFGRKIRNTLPVSNTSIDYKGRHYESKRFNCFANFCFACMATKDMLAR
jgi:hypothetical protein